MAPPTAARKLTIRASLEALGILDFLPLANCDSRDEEFSSVVKKFYFRAALLHHPDKGGDVEVFRNVQTSFELLRDLHHGNKGKRGGDWLFVDCFGATASATATAKTTKASDEEEEFDMGSYDFDFSSMETPPSWEYYEEAAEDEMPTYRVELARSARSKCSQKGKAKRCRELLPGEDNEESSTALLVDITKCDFIKLDEVRIGWMNKESGKYGGWVHLRCWRVPYKVWLGLPDPEKCDDAHKFELALCSMNDILLCGFQELHQDQKDKIIRYVMIKDNWARKPGKKKPKKPKAEEEEPAAVPSSSSEIVNQPAAAVPSSSEAITTAPRQQQRFVVPVPGKNGASPATAFLGKTFCMTGTFPEIGGGAGLSLGKEKTKAMIIAFGGRVTGSISGKTDIVVVGKAPGMSKVSKARASNKVLMVGLGDLKDGLDSGCPCLENFPVWSREEPMIIENFSAGFKGTGLALTASKKDLAVAQGILPSAKTLKEGVTTVESEDKKPAAKKRKQQEATTRTTSSVEKKKRKTASTSGKKTAVKEASTAIVVVTKPKKKTTTKKKPKTKQEFKITCDGCSTDCTERSWFYEKTDQDFCDPCHSKKNKRSRGNKAILQSKGEAVA